MVSPTPTLLLSLAAALCAAACIACEQTGRRRGVYVAKPLTMLFVLAIAARGGAPERALVLAGLVFSLAGDVFLMLPQDRFLAGLGSFLVAHLLYIAAFASGIEALAFAPLLPFLVAGAGFYALLLARLGPLRLPVAAYTAAIVAMAWLAAARWQEDGGLLAGLACAGATLFVVSDAALAWNRFRGRFAGAQALVLGSYFPAQWLIALSLGAGAALLGARG